MKEPMPERRNRKKGIIPPNRKKSHYCAISTHISVRAFATPALPSTARQSPAYNRYCARTREPPVEPPNLRPLVGHSLTLFLAGTLPKPQINVYTSDESRTLRRRSRAIRDKEPSTHPTKVEACWGINSSTKVEACRGLNSSPRSRGSSIFAPDTANHRNSYIGQRRERMP